MERQINLEGIVYAFSDEHYGISSLNPMGTFLLRNVGGTEYRGEITHTVNKLLKNKKTIGFTTDFKQLFDWLLETGRFEFEGATPSRYIKGKRIYHIF